MGKWLVIDGSFVTAKADPNDIDLILALDRNHDFKADLAPAHYNLVSKRAVQRRFGFDMLTVREETIDYVEAAAFFAQVRGGRFGRKGILRIRL